MRQGCLSVVLLCAGVTAGCRGGAAVDPVAALIRACDGARPTFYPSDRCEDCCDPPGASHRFGDMTPERFAFLFEQVYVNPGNHGNDALLDAAEELLAFHGEKAVDAMVRVFPGRAVWQCYEYMGGASEFVVGGALLDNVDHDELSRRLVRVLGKRSAQSDEAILRHIAERPADDVFEPLVRFLKARYRTRTLPVEALQALAAYTGRYPAGIDEHVRVWRRLKPLSPLERAKEIARIGLPGASASQDDDDREHRGWWLNHMAFKAIPSLPFPESLELLVWTAVELGDAGADGCPWWRRLRGSTGLDSRDEGFWREALRSPERLPRIAVWDLFGPYDLPGAKALWLNAERYLVEHQADCVPLLAEMSPESVSRAESNLGNEGFEPWELERAMLVLRRKVPGRLLRPLAATRSREEVLSILVGEMASGDLEPDAWMLHPLVERGSHETIGPLARKFPEDYVWLRLRAKAGDLSVLGACTGRDADSGNCDLAALLAWAPEARAELIGFYEKEAASGEMSYMRETAAKALLEASDSAGLGLAIRGMRWALWNRGGMHHFHRFAGPFIDATGWYHIDDTSTGPDDEDAAWDFVLRAEEWLREHPDADVLEWRARGMCRHAVRFGPSGWWGSDLRTKRVRQVWAFVDEVMATTGRAIPVPVGFPRLPGR